MIHAQRERVAYIELLARFVGRVGRAELMERFGVATAAATRDFNLYRQAAPENLVYSAQEKQYRIGADFKPLFAHGAEGVLQWLTTQQAESATWGAGSTQPLLPSHRPERLSGVDVNELAAISRAMFGGYAVSFHYYSRSGEEGVRSVVPLALVDTGLHWQMRGYFRSKRTFWNFALPRIVGVSELQDTPALPHERLSEDVQWQRVLDLPLVPHPKQALPEVIARDYAMRSGVLWVRLRAATAGHTLRHWRVDCSPDASINDDAVRLWLKDPLRLYGVDSAELAPGYQRPGDPKA